MDETVNSHGIEGGRGNLPGPASLGELATATNAAANVLDTAFAIRHNKPAAHLTNVDLFVPKAWRDAKLERPNPLYSQRGVPRALVHGHRASEEDDAVRTNDAFR